MPMTPRFREMPAPELSNRALILVTGSGQDQIGDLVRVGKQGDVARFQLNRLRLHPVREEALQFRGRGPILRRNGVPGRLSLPCRVRGLRSEQRSGDPPLYREEDARSYRIEVTSEVPEERRFAQLCVAFRFDEAGTSWRRRERGGQGGIILAGIGRAGGDVDEGGDFGIDASLADHRA